MDGRSLELEGPVPVLEARRGFVTIPPLTKTELSEGKRVLTASQTDFAPYDLVTLEIPWDLQELKAFSLEAATQWRLAVRDLMERLFGENYRGVQVMLSKPEERAFVVFANRSVDGTFDGEDNQHG